VAREAGAWPDVVIESSVTGGRRYGGGRAGATERAIARIMERDGRRTLWNDECRNQNSESVLVAGVILSAAKDLVSDATS
jgi:hypothetical protein